LYPGEAAALQTVFLSLEFQMFSFSQKWHNRENHIAPTECLKSYSFGKEIIKALCSVVIRPTQHHNCSNIYAAVLVW